MRSTKKWLRLIYIIFILNKYNIPKMLVGVSIFRILKVTFFFNPFYWFNYNKDSKGVRLRKALEDLGPIFIKFGQILSTRRDLFSGDLINELEKLQDNVPAFSTKIAIKKIEHSLGNKIDKVFVDFNYTPLASASIAQVYEAKLLTGEKVVVKLLRPNIEKVIEQDTQLLRYLASVVEKYISSCKRLKPLEVAEEISRSLHDELDLLREAASASQLKRNFKNSNMIYVPEVHWQYCRSDLLIIEKINGVIISDIEKLKASNVNLKLLAERGVEIFYTQVFRDCFFHADMHPGNVFVDISRPFDPKYISVDFGIMGTLTNEDQQYLAGNFLAFFNRNYRRVAELHIESSWVPPDTRVDSLESAIRTVCEPIFEKPLSEISFGHTLVRLFRVARSFNMTVQPQLILLQKTLLNIEGLGKELYPELNLWATAKPFLEKWMRDRMGMKNLIKRSINNFPNIGSKLPDLPEMVFKILEQKSKLEVTTVSPVEKVSYKSNRFKYKKIMMVVGIGLICTGILIDPDYYKNLVASFGDFVADNGVFITLTGIILFCLSLFRNKPRN